MNQFCAYAALREFSFRGPVFKAAGTAAVRIAGVPPAVHLFFVANSFPKLGKSGMLCELWRTIMTTENVITDLMTGGFRSVETGGDGARLG